MIEVGSKVEMTDKYYVSTKNRGRIFTVASEPWNLCGTTVVKLDGIAGGYALDGLREAKVVK